MDRRQHRLLTGGFFAAVASLLLAGFPVGTASGEPSPLPSASAPPAAVSPAASTTPASPPKPSAAPKTAVPAPPPAKLPPAATPRPTPANPRPWEWSQWSQENPSADRSSERSASPSVPRDAEAKPTDGEDSAAVQRLIEHLPNDERTVFLRNFKRWAQMTAEERQTLRRQANERHQRMQQEMDSALRESGLHLDEDRREMFMLRYGQERRRLERELQEKVAAERARRGPEIIQRLRREFEQVSSPPPSATATPAGSTPAPRP